MASTKAVSSGDSDGVENKGVSGFASRICRSCDALLHGVIEMDGGGLHGLLAKCSANAASMCWAYKPRKILAPIGMPGLDLTMQLCTFTMLLNFSATKDFHADRWLQSA